VEAGGQRVQGQPGQYSETPLYWPKLFIDILLRMADKQPKMCSISLVKKKCKVTVAHDIRCMKLEINHIIKCYQRYGFYLYKYILYAVCVMLHIYYTLCLNMLCKYIIFILLLLSVLH
jgi:hypothetical protein